MDEFVCVPFDRVIELIYGVNLVSNTYIATSYDKLPINVRVRVSEENLQTDNDGYAFGSFTDSNDKMAMVILFSEEAYLKALKYLFPNQN